MFQHIFINVFYLIHVSTVCISSEIKQNLSYVSTLKARHLGQKGSLMAKHRNETYRGSKWFGAETSENFLAKCCTELIDWFTDF